MSHRGELLSGPTLVWTNENRPRHDRRGQSERWHVKQSIEALSISRRLKIDYETLTQVSAATLLFASIGRLLASLIMR